MSGPLRDLPTRPVLIEDDQRAGPARTLAGQYGATPLSVLDKRAGWWQARRASWLDLGIQSEVGREAALTYGKAFGGYSDRGYTSIFDPVLCELVYHWWSRPGDVVLDPFCGGSVRGVVASWMGRWYHGVDLLGPQVDANRDQAGIASPDLPPAWLQGDARDCADLMDMQADLVFTCPPYADLERYSDDPRDLSTLDYPDFLQGLSESIGAALRILRDDRFVVLVLGDVRDQRGQLRGLTSDVIVRLRTDHGLTLHSQAVLLTPPGTVGMQMGRHFHRHRKLGRVHQDVVIFAHGSARTAAERLAAS